MFSRFSAVDRNKTKRKKSRSFADTLSDSGWSPRSIVSVFGLGFGVTFVLLAACIGVYYLMPAKSTPASTPVAQVRPAPLEVEDSVGMVPVAPPVGEADVPDTAPAEKVGEADAAPPTTQVLAEEPTQHSPGLAAPATPKDVAPPPAETIPAPPPPAQPEVAMAAPPATPMDAPQHTAAGSAPAPHKHAHSGTGTLVLDGQDTRTPVVLRKGVAYVAAEAFAVRSGLNMEMSPAGEVTFNGGLVRGSLTEGDTVLVPIQGLAAAIHRRARQTGASWCLDKQLASAGHDADAHPHHGAHHPHQDSLATVAVTHSDVPPAAPAPAKANVPEEVPAPAATLMEDAAPVGPVPEAFRPIIQSNGDMEITVTNVELVNSFRDTYKPGPGKQFAVVSLSLQNQSDMIQMTSGAWELRDQNNASARSLDRISTLLVGTMRPAGINYGYLVFEIDQGSIPTQLVYTQTNRSPLVVGLRTP